MDILSFKSRTTNLRPIDTPEGRIGWELTAPMIFHEKDYTKEEWQEIIPFLFKIYSKKECIIELRLTNGR